MRNEASTLLRPIRVAIVEDLPNIRESLVTLISEAEALGLSGVAKTGEEAFERFPSLKPEVVLMDIGLPGMSGVECVQLLKDKLPETEFMMLTILEDHASVYASLQAGATGYLVKGLAAERLVDSIQELHAGGSPMSSSIARRIIQKMLSPAPAVAPETALSMREEEVLRMLASGQRYKEIAESLSLSIHTVRTHIHRIYKKLHAKTKADAVRFFRKTTGDNPR